MVVGKGSYINTSEAYPLDKKTLNQIALRSFFVRSAYNGETGESVGWLYAMLPGLQKIHTDQVDLALAMGHHLEYVDTGSFFGTLAMGITLSLEQQKADLETIRSVRTIASSLSKALGYACFYGILFPLFVAACTSMVNEGNVLVPVIYFVIMALCSVIARFALLKIGYVQGTKVIDKVMRHKDALKHASRIGGIFMVGSLLVYLGKLIDPIYTFNGDNNIFAFSTLLSKTFPGVLGIGLTLWVYHLLTKKNWSLMKCVILIVVLAMVGSFFGIWQGISATPIMWPWLS